MRYVTCRSNAVLRAASGGVPEDSSIQTEPYERHAQGCSKRRGWGGGWGGVGGSEGGEEVGLAGTPLLRGSPDGPLRLTLRKWGGVPPPPPTSSGGYRGPI